MKRYLIFLIIILFHIEANSQDKDTLFFKFDKQYIIPSLGNENNYILKDSHEEGTFFFTIEEIYKDLEFEEPLCLKKYVRKSEFYDKKRKRKLNDYRLMGHFSNYEVFLIKDDKFIKVTSSYSID